MSDGHKNKTGDGSESGKVARAGDGQGRAGVGAGADGEDVRGAGRQGRCTLPLGFGHRTSLGARQEGEPGKGQWQSACTVLKPRKRKVSGSARRIGTGRSSQTGKGAIVPRVDPPPRPPSDLPSHGFRRLRVWWWFWRSMHAEMAERELEESNALLIQTGQPDRRYPFLENGMILWIPAPRRRFGTAI